MNFYHLPKDVANSNSLLRMKTIIALLFCFVGYTGCYSTKDLKCSVCKVVIQEMEKEIAKVNPNKKINLSHRINEKGKVTENTKQYMRSEIHLSELMDRICEKMDDYVRAKNKTTGQIGVIQLVTDDGVMNPDFDKYEIVQDSDLNKSLKFYVSSIMLLLFVMFNTEKT
ncbi:UNVERIFIED_CONTAM: hypothetical protein PYX00_010045 [Menopon gallinae]|uniref:DUF3456 domain-containing protein n=1 Tax=Menopon gallinae TaxID=328185 RepID=A0AAW2HDX7_9NEOP